MYTEEIKDGVLKGKLALYATLKPTDDLIEMNKSVRKCTPLLKSPRNLQTPEPPILSDWR